ncbi:Peptidase S8/S53 domain [Phytophthora cactorum]|nr:Peptidase S8/S53 domain [Phytophthora cactorum]
MQATFMQGGVTDDKDPFAVKTTPSLRRFRVKFERTTPAVIREQYDILRRSQLTIPWCSRENTSKRIVWTAISSGGHFLHEFYSEEDLKQFLRTIDGQHERITMPKPLDSASRLTVQLRPDTHYAADNQEPFLTFLQDVNAMQPPPAVVSISYTDTSVVYRIHAEAVNRELMKALFVASPSCFCWRRWFMSMFRPRPDVTAVGATTIATGSARDGNGKWKEAVTSTSEARVLITSACFSDLTTCRVPAQSGVSYLVFASSTGISPYFPVGHAFPVVVNGEVGATDGTSVSAPVLASMVTLLNRALPELPPLGFLNPLLYRLYDVCPHVFADIIKATSRLGSWDAPLLDVVERPPWLFGSQKSSNDFATTEQLSAMLLDEQELEEDSDNHVMSWTPVEQRATQFLGVVSLICAVSLICVLVALRERLFLDSGDQRTGQGDMGLVPRATPPANTYFLINQAKTRTD